MTDTNSAGMAVLTACCLCLVLLAMLTLLMVSFLRRRGRAALPLFQLLFDRPSRDDPADRFTRQRPAAKPDLRAIARQHDFDAALARHEPPSAPPAAPPGFEMPPTPLQPDRDSPRTRDEDDEIGFESLDP